jgi:hypothetical protein
MSGDLFLEYITDDEYTALKEIGAKVIEEIHHSNNYSADSYAILNGRTVGTVESKIIGHKKNSSHSASGKKSAAAPIVAFNRKGLPSHIYIELKNNEFEGYKNAPEVQDILARTFQPAAFISPTNDFQGWTGMSSDSKLKGLMGLLPRRSVTLEIYYYRSTSAGENLKLIDTGGVVNEKFRSFKLVPEKDFSQPAQAVSASKKIASNKVIG